MALCSDGAKRNSGNGYVLWIARKSATQSPPTYMTCTQTTLPTRGQAATKTRLDDENLFPLDNSVSFWLVSTYRPRRRLLFKCCC